MRAAGDQAGEMRYVDHEIRADAVGNLAETREIDEARISRAAGDDQLRLLLPRQALDLVHVDMRVLAPDSVMDRPEPFARLIHRRTVGQVAAGGERHAHEDVAGLEQCHEHGLVRPRAGMRLHVREAAGEELLRAIDSALRGLVDEFAAAVITAAGIAFGIFVRQHRALRLEHGARHDVLGGDELDLVLLPLELAANRSGDVGIGLGQRRRKETVGGRSVPGRGHTSAFTGENFATRRARRPPSNGVEKKTLRQSRASSNPRMRPPSTSTLASLCWRASRAVRLSWTSAARTPR